MVLDFPSGAWTPLHSHGGQTLVTILAGEVTERRDGVETIYKPGEGWTEQPGALHEAGNTGTEPASLTALFLLPKGAELTTVQAAAPAALPQTGGDVGSRNIWLLLVSGSGLIAGGWLVRRQRGWA